MLLQQMSRSTNLVSKMPMQTAAGLLERKRRGVILEVAHARVGGDPGNSSHRVALELVRATRAHGRRVDGQVVVEVAL